MMWLSFIINSRFGRAVGIAVGAVLLVVGIRRSGYNAARRDRAAADVQSSLDIRRRADEALRRSEGDMRPVDDRIEEHGRLRDD